ncbi:MAG: tetratricopeptide repeat protein [Verrucomicrobia bacterium]|nr:tetratricopeptide repeat protein [Verrucomicrobiota bacterium]
MTYSETHFPREEAGLIIDKLQDLLDELVPRFMDMYRESMTSHPTPEIAQEIELIHYLLGGLPEETFAFYSSAFSEESQEYSSFYDWDISCCRKKKSKPKPPAPSSVPTQPQPQSIDWTLSMIHLAKGQAFNELLLYNAAIESLTQAIRLNPRSEEAYIERAYAYFELGEIELALKDHQKYKVLTTITLFTVPVGRQTPTCHPVFQASLSIEEFNRGLHLGMLEGVALGLADFVPSTLSCLRGIAHGLWSFACSPQEVTREIGAAAVELMEYIKTHSTHENFGLFLPEVRELCEQWDLLSDRARGHQMGYIIGKYGMEILIPGTTLKAIGKYRLLKRANTLLTLECCEAAGAKRAAILQASAKRFSKRQALVAEIATKGKIVPQNPNVIPHVLAKHHVAW